MLRPLTAKESEQIPMLLHCTNDVERIGDHAEIIHGTVRRLLSGELRFSADAEAEYNRLHDTLAELTAATIQMLEAPCPANRDKAVRLQGRIETMLESSETEHFTRISNGDCKPQVGMLYLELVEEMRKISRHLENIHERAAMFYGKFPDVRDRAAAQLNRSMA